MLKKYFTFLAISLIAAAGCENKISPEVSPAPETPVVPNTPGYEIVKTFIGNSTQCKTSLNDETVLWESGDAIKVLWGENSSNKAVGRPYGYNGSAEFTTTVGDADAYYGVYPYDALSTLNGGKLQVTIPAQQTGLFKESNIIVAKADEDNVMNFKHVLSYIEFTIDKVGQLKFYGGNPLVGDIDVEFNTDGSLEYEQTPGNSVVTIDIKSSGTYYIAMLPDTKIDGFNFEITHEGKTQYINTTTSKQMKRGAVVGLGNITSRFSSQQSIGATLEEFTIVEFEF